MKTRVSGTRPAPHRPAATSTPKQPKGAADTPASDLNRVLQLGIDGSPRVLAQRRAIRAGFGTASFPRERFSAGSGGVAQRLSDDQLKKLTEYAREKVDDCGSYVPRAEWEAAVDAAKNKHTGEKSKDYTAAKSDFDKWLKGYVDAKRVTVVPAKGPEPSGPSTGATKALAPHAPVIGSVATGPGKEKKSKKTTKLSLGEFFEQTPSAPLDFSKAATKAAQLPAPVATPVDEKRWEPVLAKVKSWKPSTGHEGCRAYNLTTADLQEICNWVEGQGRHFLRIGAGTGGYSDKDQLKVIHKTVDDKPSRKNATYHISANSDALAGLKDIERKDD